MSRVSPFSFYIEDNCKPVHKLELFFANSLSSSSIFSRAVSFSFAAFLSALDLESSISLAFSSASFARECIKLKGTNITGKALFLFFFLQELFFTSCFEKLAAALSSALQDRQRNVFFLH